MNKRTQTILIITLTVLPFILMLLFWEAIPDRIPIHWNVKMEPDSFGDKATHVPLIAGLGIATQAIFWLLPLIDPKKRTAEHAGTIGNLQIIFGLFHVVLFTGLLSVWTGHMENPSDFIILGVLFLLGAIGNFFGKLKPNYFIGIRTPWTLESEDVWRSTHRLGGKLWVGSAILLAILYPLIDSEIYIYFFLTGVLTISFIPIVYSFILSKKLEKNQV